MAKQTSKETKAKRQRLPDEVLRSRIERRLVRNERGCLIWPGAIGRGGYGIVWNGKSNMPAHRAVYEVMNGVRLTRWQFVCHQCDAPACANITHLWLGTPKQNTADMDAKGRRVITEKLRNVLRMKPAAGSKNNMARLTDAQVDEIRASSDAAKAIAERFGVTRNHVYKIRNGWRWNDAR